MLSLLKINAVEGVSFFAEFIYGRQTLVDKVKALSSLRADRGELYGYLVARAQG